MRKLLDGAHLGAAAAFLAGLLASTHGEAADPVVAVRKAEKLLQQDKVDLLTGTVNSGSTLAVGQVAERNDRILVTTDRKSTRLNSSHGSISYAVFCLKK